MAYLLLSLAAAEAVATEAEAVSVVVSNERKKRKDKKGVLEYPGRSGFKSATATLSAVKVTTTTPQ